MGAQNSHCNLDASCATFGASIGATFLSDFALLLASELRDGQRNYMAWRMLYHSVCKNISAECDRAQPTLRCVFRHILHEHCVLNASETYVPLLELTGEEKDGIVSDIGLWWIMKANNEKTPIQLSYKDDYIQETSRYMIRLPLEVDPDLRSTGTSRFSVNSKKVEEMVEMYTRELLVRDWSSHPSNGFTVLEFNTLAKQLGPTGGFVLYEKEPVPFPGFSDEQMEWIKSGTNTKPFPAMTQKSQEWEDKQNELRQNVLQWKQRKWRLLAVVLQHSPSIAALAEVDRFGDFWYPAMWSQGYQGIWNGGLNQSSYRVISDSVGMTMGVALFWKRDEWDLVIEETPNVYRQMSRKWEEWPLVTTARLQHRRTHQRLRVCAVHLASGEDDKWERMRKTQIDDILEALNNLEPCNSILLGDFNADPFYTFDDGTQESCINALNEKWKSVYTLPSNETEQFAGKHSTTIKHRDGKDAIQFKKNKQTGEYGDIKDKRDRKMRTIDYIFHKGLKVHRTLLLPSAEYLKNYGMNIPSRYYPSDHFALVAEMKFSTEVSKKRQLPPLPLLSKSNETPASSYTPFQFSDFYLGKRAKPSFL